MLSELARVVAVFVSLRSRQSDDQAEIRHLQNQDMLTELYNLDTFRRLIREKLKSGGLAQDENMVYALVNLDVNNFAYVGGRRQYSAGACSVNPQRVPCRGGMQNVFGLFH